MGLNPRELNCSRGKRPVRKRKTIFLFDLVSVTTAEELTGGFVYSGALMKQVVIIVKPFLAERVLEAVAELEVDALAVHEVKGYGRQKSYLDATTEQDRSLAFLPKVEIQCWVEDSQIDNFIDKVSQVACEQAE